MDYYGHPKHPNLPASSPPARSNMSSDEYHHYLRSKDNHSLRRNVIKIRWELNIDVPPVLESSSMKNLILPLPVSSSASTTKAISLQKRKPQYRQQFKTNAISPRDPETSFLNQKLTMGSRFVSGLPKSHGSSPANLWQSRYPPKKPEERRMLLLRIPTRLKTRTTNHSIQLE